MSRPGAVDAEVAATLLRSCHSRRLDREGIPMILVLADERGGRAVAADDSTRQEGAGYADLLEAYAEVLTPASAFRPDDEGALITVLQVLAYASFVSPDHTVAPPAAPESP